MDHIPGAPSTATPTLVPTSDVGSTQAPSLPDTAWMQLLDQQNQNMLRLIEAMRSPNQPTTITLPAFDPDQPDANPRAWCSTVEICLTERPLEGGALIIALSKSLKGTASTWLSHVSHTGMTWMNFKEIFLSRFDCAETCAATIINTNNSRPKDGESLASYATRLITSLMAKWKDMDTEEIAVSYVLAHLSQIDGRINRLAFTTEIKSRTKLVQEVQAYSMKRKQERSLDNFTIEKHTKLNSNGNSSINDPKIQCHYCHKFGHKAIDCRTRKDKLELANGSSTSVSTPKDSNKDVICYRCGERGHIALRCTTTGGAIASSAPGGDAIGGVSSGGSAADERRVNFLKIDSVLQ